MQEAIKRAIDDALKTLGIAGGDFAVDHPTDKNTGADYFSNVAMVVAKEVGQAPRVIAEQLCDALRGRIEYVDVIEVAGPGFLNFTLQRGFFAQNITAINEAGELWGKNDSHKGELVMVEYTSPNLFKPLHIGNLVGNIIGESLTRLFEYNGAKVKRLNYPSDIGLTVAKAVWGLMKTGGSADDILALGEAYRVGNDAYENDETAKDEIVRINHALYEESDPTLMAIRAQGIATSKRQLDAICERLGTTFDAVIFESEAAPTGTHIVNDAIGTVFVESNGAICAW